MPELTQNLKLKKPLPTEKIDIGVINENMDKVDNAFNEKIVLGTYTGDGTATRTINLGFMPCAVEIYYNGYKQSDINGTTIYGGLALTGKPCGDGIVITENGFTVAYNSSKTLYTNQSNYVYYFKAYRDCPIMQIS